MGNKSISSDSWIINHTCLSLNWDFLSMTFLFPPINSTNVYNSSERLLGNCKPVKLSITKYTVPDYRQKNTSSKAVHIFKHPVCTRIEI